MATVKSFDHYQSGCCLVNLRLLIWISICLVICRFFEEIEANKKFPKAFDWLKPAKVVEEAKRRLLEEDTGYLGDVDTSSGESSDSDSSDSEDKPHTTLNKGILFLSP